MRLSLLEGGSYPLEVEDKDVEVHSADNQGTLRGGLPLLMEGEEEDEGGDEGHLDKEQGRDAEAAEERVALFDEAKVEAEGRGQGVEEVETEGDEVAHSIIDGR